MTPKKTRFSSKKMDPEMALVFCLMITFAIITICILIFG